MNYLQDDNGNDSSMRLVWVIVTAIIMGTWSTVAIMTLTIPPLCWELVLLIVLLSGSKLVQKLIEVGGLKINLGGK